MSARTPFLNPGMRAPDFVLPSSDGTPTRFYGKFGGTPVVLLFYQDNREVTHKALVRLSEMLARRPGEIAVLAVNCEGPSIYQQIALDRDLGFPILSDTDGTVSNLYGIFAGDIRIILLDNNLRVLDTYALQENEPWAKRIEAVLEALPRIDAFEITAPAPVLLIPNVLDHKFCDSLINIWRTQGNIETGVEHSSEGSRQAARDSQLKRRRDHTVTDKELMRLITPTVGRIVMPEVQRAFSFKASRFEGFKIACYDAAVRGHFQAHRDNLSPATAHRRFALTLNLNEGYEGGHLRFPEYGPHLYRPLAGGAIVFSCSLLHEAMEVTRGQRFVLLSFLFGEGDLRRS